MYFGPSNIFTETVSSPAEENENDAEDRESLFALPVSARRSDPVLSTSNDSIEGFFALDDPIQKNVRSL